MRMACRSVSFSQPVRRMISPQLRLYSMASIAAMSSPIGPMTPTPSSTSSAPRVRRHAYPLRETGSCSARSRSASTGSATKSNATFAGSNTSGASPPDSTNSPATSLQAFCSHQHGSGSEIMSPQPSQLVFHPTRVVWRLAQARLSAARTTCSLGGAQRHVGHSAFGDRSGRHTLQ